MSLFKKNKKNKNYNEAEAFEDLLDLQDTDESEDLSLDLSFSLPKKNESPAPAEEDTEKPVNADKEVNPNASPEKSASDINWNNFSDMSISDDEFTSILNKYISDSEGTDEPDLQFDFGFSDSKPAVEAVSDESAVPDKTDIEEKPAAEAIPDTDVNASIADAVSESAQPESAHKRELSTDEAIAEFMKSVSMGGSIAELLNNTVPSSDDDLEIPVFAGESRSEAMDAEEASPMPQVPIEAPINLEDVDLDEPEDNTDVGSTDMNLRIAFGLDEDDDEPEEVKDAMKKMGDHFETDKRVHKKYDPDHAEFTDSTQAKDIALEFKVRLRNNGIRMFFAIVFAIIVLLYENVPTITDLITGSPKQFAGIFDPAVYPVVYIMGSLQLLMLCAVFALPELKRGVVKLFKGIPTPESITAFVVTISVLSSFITSYFATVTVVPKVYNATAAMSVIMTLIYSRLNLKREMASFFVAGGKKKKHAMNRIPDSETLLTPDDYEDDMYGDVMRVERTEFIDGFFSRMSVPDGMTNAFSAGLIGVAVAAAILFSIFASSAHTVSSITNTVYVVILTILPMAVHLAFSYPFFCASMLAKSFDSAIIGEVSLEEYASTAVVSFDDSNVFLSYDVKIQNIKTYNKARLDRVLYYASSAFKSAGGPLADVFEVATMEMDISKNVQITDADKGYLSAVVDDINITFGSFPALVQRGFDIPDAVALDDVDFSDELSIMYMFREDTLIAKLYIKYVLDSDIEPILTQFQDYGMYLCVRTFDPNIDEDMICSKLQIKDPPVKVVRYRNTDNARGVVPSVDSGFVTTGLPKLLLQLLPCCDKTIHTKRACGAITVISVIFSLMWLAISSMSNDISSFNSLYITIYHLVWVFFTFIASKIFIR